MKKIINYFYGINVNTDILTSDGLDFYFLYSDCNYCFSKVSELQVERIIKFYNAYFLFPYMHNIIVNKHGNIISTNENQKYVLMKINFSNKKITYLEIIDYLEKIRKGELLFSEKGIEWDRLWRMKVDYLEYYIQNNQSINSNIKCLCSYFIGVSENAISLVNFVKKQYPVDYNFEFVSFCHERIKKGYTLYDLYNPKNFIVDHLSRDVSEYVKTCFFEEICFEKIEQVIEKANFTVVGYVLFFARTMFPTFFFDEFNDIEQESFDNKSLIKMYDYIDNYERLIKEIYKFLEKKVSLPKLIWLET